MNTVTINIDGGNITTVSEKCKGITSDDNLTINGGDITIEKAYEGIESKQNITFNGGNINISTSDDGINSTGCLTFNGGNINVTSTGNDAIDANSGDITINGGEIIAIGTSTPDGGIDCDNNKVIINGGSLFIAGGTNSSISEESKQNVLIFDSSEITGNNVSIKTEDNEINLYTINNTTLNSGQIIISSSEINAETNYTIDIDNKNIYTITALNGITNESTAQGMMQQPGHNIK